MEYLTELHAVLATLQVCDRNPRPVRTPAQLTLGNFPDTPCHSQALAKELVDGFRAREWTNWGEVFHSS